MIKRIIIFILFSFCVNLFAQQTISINKNDSDNKNNALHFDGIDDYVEIPYNEKLSPKEFTVELWVKSDLELWNSMGSLLSFREEYVMHPLPNSKTIQFFVYEKDYCYFMEITPYDINLTKWHHYAATYDGKVISFFLDGYFVTSGKSRREKSIGLHGSLFIGTDSKMVNRYFNGEIDELRIWNYAKTEEQIQRTMNVELFGNETGLVAYYNFNEGNANGNNYDAQILYDLAGNNNGKLNNFTLLGDTSNWVKSNVMISGKGYISDLVYEIFSLLNISIFLSLIFAIFILFFLVNRSYKRRQIKLEELVLSKTNELIVENKIKASLIHEIHHRVKNNLQTISSLIYMQLKVIKEEKSRNILINTQTRINSMALIYEMLYSEDSLNNKIFIKDYLKKLVYTIGEMSNNKTKPIDFNISSDDIKLEVNQAITLGMLTTEIITNSIKYAFANVLKPEIKISFNDENNRLVFCIKDNGSGIIDEKNIDVKNSIGFKLIDIFSRQLNAELQKENSSNGLKIKITIPKNI